MRSPSSTPPNLLTFQDKAIDNPKGIKNIPNNCSSTIGKVSQAKKKNLMKITLTTSQTLIPFPLTNRQRIN